MNINGFLQNLNMDYSEDVEYFKYLMARSEVFYIPTIYEHFGAQFIQQNDADYKLLYSTFIKQLNLGVVAYTSTQKEVLYPINVNYQHLFHTDYYNIVDDKRWLFSKLKYAI